MWLASAQPLWDNQSLDLYQLCQTFWKDFNPEKVLTLSPPPPPSPFLTHVFHVLPLSNFSTYCPYPTVSFCCLYPTVFFFCLAHFLPYPNQLSPPAVSTPLFSTFLCRCLQSPFSFPLSAPAVSVPLSPPEAHTSLSAPIVSAMSLPYAPVLQPPPPPAANRIFVFSPPPVLPKLPKPFSSVWVAPPPPPDLMFQLPPLSLPITCLT